MRAVPKHIFRLIFILFFILSTIQLHGQSAKSKLEKDIKENGKMFNENLDKAFSNIDILINEAVKQKNYSAHLILLDRKCRYFYNKNQIDELIVNAEKLNSTATANKDIYFLGMSDIYLAEAYSINGLHDRALSHLSNAYEILNNDRSGQKKIFLAKANVLNSFANVYSDKGEPAKAVQKLREVIRSYNVLQKDEDISQFQYVNYSNIASLYADYKADSAKYFALKSIELKPKGKQDDAIMMMNYYILGKAYKDISKNKEAILYFHKALHVSEVIGVELNKKIVYSSLMDLYNSNGKKDSANIYENKLKKIEIDILQSKYNSLKRVVVEDEKNSNNSSSAWLYLLLAAILIIIIVVFFIKRQKTNNTISTPQESYTNLIELATNKDPSFMLTFELMFPNFTTKILNINPDLQKSEIEFCALLTMNLPTKDIARILFIEPRSVQNKKYRIRKRLDIPSDVNIYHWFNSFAADS